MAGSYYEVEVRPDAKGWSAKLEAQVGPQVKAFADQIRERLQNAMRDGLNGSGINAGLQGRRLGGDFADAFDRELKGKMRAALNSLPSGKARLLIDGSPAERELAKIRADLVRITDANIGVDLSDKAALAQLEELKLRLTRLTGPEHDIRLRVNSKAALAELAAIKLAATGATDSVSKIGAGGAGSAAGGPGLMVGGILAGLTTVGPLAAAAAGGLIGAAGAAGVLGLAVLGVKRQMAEQVGIGQELSEQFKGITREANGLADVAANAVGPGVRDVLDSLLKAVPRFEGLTELVGGRLGGAARELGDALLMGFEKSQPLIVEVAGYIEDGAAALSRWVASPSFDHFLTYARQELPTIINDAKDFGVAIVDTFKALSTTGEGVLKTLDTVAKAVSYLSDHTHDQDGNSLFGGIFGYGWQGKADKDKNTATSYIDGLLADYQRFTDGITKTTQVATPLEAFQSITGDLVPPLQLASAGSNQFATSVLGIVDRLRSATPALQTYMDTAAQYATNTNPTLADTAKLLGDALTASRGNVLDYTATLVQADTSTQDLAKTIHDNIASVNKDGTLLGVSHLDTAGKFVDASNKYSAGASAIIQSFQAQVTAATDAATATFTNEKATKGQALAAADALTIYKGYRQSVIDSSVAQGTARETAKALADQYFAIPSDVDTFVKLLGQDNVNFAIEGLTDALNRLSDFIGAPTIGLNHTDYDIAARFIHGDLDYYGNTTVAPSLDLTNGQFNQKAAQSKTLLDQLGITTVTPTVGLNDQASAGLAAIIGRLGAIDREVYVTVHERTVQGLAPVQGRQAYAHGGFYNAPAFAGGGIVEGIQNKLRASVPSFANGTERHLPQISPAVKPFRIWSEPETKGEAYIPLADDFRRRKAEQILDNVAHRFGGAYFDRAFINSVRSGAMEPTASATVSTGLAPGQPVTVNVIDRDGSFVERMRGEIASDKSTTALAGSAGPASRLT